MNLCSEHPANPMKPGLALNPLGASHYRRLESQMNNLTPRLESQMNNPTPTDTEQRAQRWKKYKVDKVRLRFWYEKEEYEAIKEKAVDCGLSVNEFVKRAALGKKITSNSDAQLASALSKLGGLQVKLNSDLRAVLSDNNSVDITKLIADHNQLYREIHNAIREARNDNKRD